MTRLLLVSGDPVGPRMAGPGIRAFEMTQALERSGIRVDLVAPGPPLVMDGVPVGSTDDPAAVSGLLARADAVLASGMTLAQLPLVARQELPVVVDLYGPYVLENLSAAGAGGPAAAERARRHGSDQAALALHLRRGDYFICASEVQRDFWLGMLSALGRVNPATHAADPSLRDLIDVVPFGLPNTPPTAGHGPVARGVWPGVGRDDELVLWGGGLWDWLDPATLVEAVALLAPRRPALCALFLSGAVPSPAVGPMAAGPLARARSDALGLTGRAVVFHDEWLPYHERGALLLEANLGASLHRPHVEARFAFRTRLLDCFWAGLPVVVTGGDVLSEVVGREGLGQVVPPGDAGAVAQAVEAILETPRGRTAYAAAFDVVRARYRWDRVVEPLAAFLERPHRAADNPTVAAQIAETPAWRLPGRAVAVARAGGLPALAGELGRYLKWRRRAR